MSLQRILTAPAVLFLGVVLACRNDVARLTGAGSHALAADNVTAQATTSRSIDEFIAAQASFTAWTAPEQKTGARGDNLFILMDYAGIRARQIIAAGGPDLGTTFSGTVSERALSDGTAEVHVVLHTDHAFTLGRRLLDGTLIFGHTAGQVVAGADVALGHCDLEITFVNSAPGAPLPDITTLDFATMVKDILFRGSADGTLRAAFGVADGTPGRGHVVQNGLFQASGKGATADGFPAELITFTVVGQ
jgi:hypothetical protein